MAQFSERQSRLPALLEGFTRAHEHLKKLS